MDVSVSVKWVSCYHGMPYPQVTVGGENVQIQQIAVNAFNEQLHTADRGWSSSLGVGWKANNYSL
jgi:hypothetical protein